MTAGAGGGVGLILRWEVTEGARVTGFGLHAVSIPGSVGSGLVEKGMSKGDGGKQEDDM